ncbi:uncharacterized protein LOC141646187 [Silene latifolia]|uniref:uncharacterized protein LOC141646187 n=1 Tax=Silene latifolia TaxID=37657 RepID=UPI003D76C4EE
MEEHTLREVELITGMKRGTMPFSYLGVTVSPKRLSVHDCQCLVDKVVDRVRGMGSRKLSYDGRLVLIKAVLSTLHGYWARIFILPKTVISKIEAICRKYLWHGADHKESPALVSWDSICQPRKQGGLGLRDFHVWNLATVGKYAWWVANKEDHLWVRWVHAVYIKSSSWWEYISGSGCSWAWRKICQVKQLLKPYLSNLFSEEHYTITAGYQWLKPTAGQVPWYPWMLNQWLIPRHHFMCWLLAQRRLLTQDRLLRMRIIQSNSCFLCGMQEENLNHLFFECPFSETKRGHSRWRCGCRNKCRVEESVVRPSVVLANVKNDVKMRLGQCDIRSKNALVLEWVEYLKA